MSRGQRTLPKLLLAVITPCILLAGCSSMDGATQAPVVAEPEPSAEGEVEPSAVALPRRASDAEALLAYFAQLRKLGGPDLAKEADTARQAYDRARSDYNRMRLAMVMTLPNTPFQDDSRALDLLEPVAKSPDSQLSGLALLLVSQLEERRRLDASAQALQHKLDALKSLERSMVERRR
jgi:hypothetical protein